MTASFAGAVQNRASRFGALARATNRFVLPALLAPRSAPLGGRSPLILVLVFSDLRIDPRVRREARALAAAGFNVKILYPDAMSTPSDPVSFDFGPGIEFRSLPASAASYIGRY